MSKILILANYDVGLYKFRKELIEELLKNHQVYISVPEGKYANELEKMGCHFIETNVDRRGKNPIRDLKLINFYKKIMAEINPAIVFSYTIKPNIYGALAAKKNNIPFVANITGLGSAVENGGIFQKISLCLYKIAFTNVQTVYFQNKENRQFFIDNNIAIGKHKMLPGSGVNLEYFSPIEYPSSDTIEFVFISRIMKEKGIDQYLDAAEHITKRYPNTKFHICGFCEEEYEEILEDYQSRGIIIYHGMVNDVRKILRKTHCTVHPTYYPEGMSNVLLESASSARPVITTDRSGTSEIVQDEITGYLVKQKNSEDLINKIEVFLNLPYEEKINMGLFGRRKVSKEFNRQIIVTSYLNELNSIIEK